MLELGIILLELWHNKRVEPHASEEKLRIDDDFSNQ